MCPLQDKVWLQCLLREQCLHYLSLQVHVLWVNCCCSRCSFFEIWGDSLVSGEWKALLQFSDELVFTWLVCDAVLGRRGITAWQPVGVSPHLTYVCFMCIFAKFIHLSNEDKYEMGLWTDSVANTVKYPPIRIGLSKVWSLIHLSCLTRKEFQTATSTFQQKWPLPFIPNIRDTQHDKTQI